MTIRQSIARIFAWLTLAAVAAALVAGGCAVAVAVSRFLEPGSVSIRLLETAQLTLVGLTAGAIFCGLVTALAAGDVPIALKQMRQRLLSSLLTLVSVLLGVALAVVILLIRRESATLFGQTDYGYDILIGAKASPLQLVLNTVYHLDASPGNIPYSIYEKTQPGGPYFAAARIAIPTAVGDTYQGLRIVGTVPQLFGREDDGVTPIAPEKTMDYRPGKKYTLSAGRVFHARKFEAVIGAEVGKLTGLKLGDKFKATHGMPKPGSPPDEHPEEWTVVGVLNDTRTAADRVLYIPFISFMATPEHEEALEAQADIRLRDSGGPAPAERDHGHDHEPAATQPNAQDDHDHADHDHADHDHADHDHADHEHADHDHADHDHADHDHADDDHGEHDHAADSATQAAAAPHDDHAHDDHAHDHHDHDEAYTLNPDGTIDLKLPKEKWALSAILVRGRSVIASQQLMYELRNGNEATAVNPASEMRKFFGTFLEPSMAAWGAVAYLVNLVAVVAILVSIYNSVAARLRDIAILRALGATRTRVLTMICFEAGLIGFAGALLGVLAGHVLAAAASGYLQQTIGESIRWWVISPEEWFYLLAVTAVAALAGLVPALKAYKTPVAGNLTA